MTTPTRIANRAAAQYAAKREEFKGSNLFAVWEGNAYTVYSYGFHFPLFTYTNGEWFGNTDKYSVTTTWHKSYSQPVPPTSIRWLNTRELSEVIRRYV
jgi:hypothetical protein